jgi:hypothetical protein
MLCAQWNMKKYRSAKKEEIFALIASHQKMRELYKKSKNSTSSAKTRFWDQRCGLLM